MPAALASRRMFANDHVTLDLGAGRQGMLVPWHDIERFTDVEGARRLLRQAQGFAATDLRELVGAHGRLGGLDDDEVIDAAAEMLASGRFVLVTIGRRHAGSSVRPGAERSGEAWPHLPKLSELAPKPTTWFEVQCVGTRGQTYAGAQVRLVLPDGTVRETRLDDASKLRLLDLPMPDGPCKLELAANARPSGRLSLAQRKRRRAARVSPGGEAVKLKTGERHELIVEERHAYSA